MSTCSVIVPKFHNSIPVNETFKRRNILILKSNDAKCMSNFKTMHSEKDKILFDTTLNFEFQSSTLHIKPQKRTVSVWKATRWTNRVSER